eukprot:3316723-Prymnesium_polylepis.2
MIPGGEAPYDGSNTPWLELGVEEGPPPELLEPGPGKTKRVTWTHGTSPPRSFQKMAAFPFRRMATDYCF